MLLGIALLLPACGGGGGEEKKSDTPGIGEMAQAAKDMAAAAEEMSESMQEEEMEPVPPVDYEVLLRFLPDQIADFERGEPTGETASYGNWSYSQVRATYQGKDNNHYAEVEIFDYAHIRMLYAPFMMLRKMNFNKKSTEGFERSEDFYDFPGYVEYKKDGDYCKGTVLVGSRFIVNVETRGLGEMGARNVIESMEIPELANQKSDQPS
jgi:hypothetical protein